MEAGFATREIEAGFPIREIEARFAIREIEAGFATREIRVRFATREIRVRFATREIGVRFATREMQRHSRLAKRPAYLESGEPSVGRCEGDSWFSQMRIRRQSRIWRGKWLQKIDAFRNQSWFSRASV